MHCEQVGMLAPCTGEGKGRRGNRKFQRVLPVPRSQWPTGLFLLGVALVVLSIFMYAKLATLDNLVRALRVGRAWQVGGGGLP